MSACPSIDGPSLTADIKDKKKAVHESLRGQPSVNTSKKRRIYKPGFVPLSGRHHPSCRTVARPISLATYPRIMGMNIPSLLGLARDEACRAAFVAEGAVGSYPAISPLPERQPLRGCRFAESLRIPRLDRRYSGFPRAGRPPWRFIFCCAVCHVREFLFPLR